MILNCKKETESNWDSDQNWLTWGGGPPVLENVIKYCFYPAYLKIFCLKQGKKIAKLKASDTIIALLFLAFFKQGKKIAKLEAFDIIIALLFSAFYAYKEAKTANLLSQSFAKRLILR